MESIARITGGVDTHLDVHVVAALDDRGGLLGTASFPANPTGYGELLCWLRSFGELVLVGVEGTGSYGAGLARLLHRSGVAVVEVDRPNRADRRKRGKSDTLDAIAAARAAHAGTATGRPKTRDGNIEAIRVLRTARQSAHKARTQAINQIRSLVCTAPGRTTRTTAPPPLNHYGVGTGTAGAILVGDPRTRRPRDVRKLRALRSSYAVSLPRIWPSSRGSRPPLARTMLRESRRGPPGCLRGCRRCLADCWP